MEANHPLNPNNELEKITNKFIKEITYNIENFSYNKIIANFHETYSALNKIILNKIDKEKLVKNYKKILIALSPVIPHFSSECMEMISIKENLKWPEVEEKFLFNDNVKFIIQFNGKTRKIIVSEKNTTESLLLTKIKEDSKLSEYLNNKNIQKKIFIPNKLINIITS
jgi:leucyl-tRNA synthetase